MDINEVKHFVKTGEILPLPTIEERIKVCKEHLLFSMKWKGEKLGILEMRRHYANYLKGFPNIKEFRLLLVQAETWDALQIIFENIIQTYSVKEMV